jgi:hypothetical protein
MLALLPKSTILPAISLLILAAGACGDGESTDDADDGAGSGATASGGSSGSSGDDGKGGAAGSSGSGDGAGQAGALSGAAGAGEGGAAVGGGNSAGEAGADAAAGGNDAAGAGGEVAGAGGHAGQPPAAEGIYVVGGYLTSQEDWIGYLAVTDDISATGSIDLANVIEFPGDMSFASPGNGVIYVGDGGAPVVERWILNESRELVRDAEMGLAQFGIASGLGMKDPLHFLAPDRAYFIDGDSLQVVIWNPQTMETEDSFSIEGFLEEGMFLGLNYVHRDGDRLLLSARYWRADDTAALLTRIGIIDTTNDSVSYVDDTRCGNVAFHARDSQNNLYLATHTAQTGTIAVGAAGDPVAESCIIRFKAGANDFDLDYYVGLDELAGGHAGGIMRGAGDQAFVLKYAGPAFTLDNYARAHTLGQWEVHSLTLGDEAATFGQVAEVGLQSGYGLAFTTEVDGKDVPYVIAVEGDFSEGAYYDVSTPGKFERALTVPGFPAKAILVR